MTEPFKAELWMTVSGDRELFDRHWRSLGDTMWRTLETLRTGKWQGEATLTATLAVEEKRTASNDGI